jgi:hypothetical protein
MTESLKSKSQPFLMIESKEGLHGLLHGWTDSPTAGRSCVAHDHSHCFPMNKFIHSAGNLVVSTNRCFQSEASLKQLQPIFIVQPRREDERSR